jgi:hypothetical protein
MPVSGKPPKKVQVSPEALEAFLNKGGESAVVKQPATTRTEVKKPVTVDRVVGRPKKDQNSEPLIPTQLRLTQSKLDEIDKAISERKIKVSRHAWFLEAIELMLSKDK